MKQIIIVALVLMLSAGSAIAGEIYTKSTTAEAGTVIATAFVANKRQIPVMEYMSVLATAASSDVVVYAGGDSSTTYDHATAKAVADTTFDVGSCTGFDNGDLVVIQWQGGTVEADVMASCNDTTDQMTLTAGLANAITSTQSAANRIQIYEMTPIWSLSNVGTSRLTFGPGPVVVGTKSFPFAVSIIGTGAIEFTTVDYK